MCFGRSAREWKVAISFLEPLKFYGLEVGGKTLLFAQDTLFIGVKAVGVLIRRNAY